MIFTVTEPDKMDYIYRTMIEKKISKIRFDWFNGAYLRSGQLYCNGNLDRIVEKLENFDDVNSEPAETEFYLSLSDVNW
jgi:hypothetical protein